MKEYRYQLSLNEDGKFKLGLADLTPCDAVIQAETVENIRIEERFFGNRYPLTLEQLTEKLRQLPNPPQFVKLCGLDTAEEVCAVLTETRVKALSLFKCPDLADLHFLEQFQSLQCLEIYWNRKATELFCAYKMPNLVKFEMTNCNKVVRFDGLRNSNLQYLGMFGCNYCSSFTSKLDAGDLAFLEEMPRLKHLQLEIVKAQPAQVYLKAIAKATQLENIYVSSSFFTFEQFAWLSAHLPNVKEDLEPCTYYISQTQRGTAIVPEVDEYRIIGRHKTFAKRKKAEMYLNAYNKLRTEFASSPEPPDDDFKVALR